MKRETKQNPKKKFKNNLVYLRSFTRRYLTAKARIIWQLIFVLFFFGILFLIFKSDFFKIKFIQCFTEGNLCSNTELDLFKHLYGENIFFINKNELVKEAKIKNIGLKEIKLKSYLPNKLMIYLQNRRAVVLLKTEKSEFLVDETGVVFKEVSQKNYSLPLIILKNQTLSLGGEVNERVLKAIQLTKNLQELFVPFDNLTLEDKNYFTVKGGNFLAIFSPEKDLFNQAISLQMILQSSKIKIKEEQETFFKENKIRRIDLRFDKPIISFND